MCSNAGMTENNGIEMHVDDCSPSPQYDDAVQVNMYVHILKLNDSSLLLKSKWGCSGGFGNNAVPKDTSLSQIT